MHKSPLNNTVANSAIEPFEIPQVSVAAEAETAAYSHERFGMGLFLYGALLSGVLACDYALLAQYPYLSATG